MFELSREDICKWRKEHNRLLIEEFKEINNETSDQKKDESFQEWREEFFKKLGNVINEYDKKMGDNERQQIRQWIESFKKLNETLDSTSEGTNEKIEIKEDPSTLLSQKKSNKT